MWSLDQQQQVRKTAAVVADWSPINGPPAWLDYSCSQLQKTHYHQDIQGPPHRPLGQLHSSLLSFFNLLDWTQIQS